MIGWLGFSVVVYTVSSFANDEFQQWKQQQSSSVQTQKNEFQDYKDKRDKEFTSFLKAQWKAVDLLKGEIRDQAPKPDVLPVAPPDPSSNVTPVQKPVVSFIEPVIGAPVDTTKPKPKPVIAPGDKSLVINFYGNKIRFYYDVKLKQHLPRQVNRQIDKTAISDYWSAVSRTNYEGLLKQLDEQNKFLQLNDWGYASLINKIALKINTNRANETALLSWFLLAKSGYKARVAYNDSSIYLLVPSQQEMFEVSYFTFGNKRYYAVVFDGVRQNMGRVFTYDGEYPDTTKDFNMQVTSTVASGNQSERRRLSFEFEGQKYNIEVIYDRGRIQFFKTYPQLALNLYFDSGVDKITATPLETQLAEYIQGMPEEKAVNFLLRFVQTSLQYETDDKQFGEENYLFPEETLFYPYSDCEDRAVLFAWLVKSLLNLDVVGLDYPGHVATAVHFNEAVEGDSVTYNGKRYVVADPTYINANAGMSMPNFKQFKPAIIAY
jgi:hypothetical protein